MWLDSRHWLQVAVRCRGCMISAQTFCSIQETDQLRSLSEPRGRALLKTWRSWRKFGWFGWCLGGLVLKEMKWGRQRRERHVSDSSRARTVVPSSFQRRQSSTKKVTPNTEPYQLQFSRSTKTALLMVQVNYLFF